MVVKKNVRSILQIRQEAASETAHRVPKHELPEEQCQEVPQMQCQYSGELSALFLSINVELKCLCKMRGVVIKGVISAKMVKIIKFLFFVQKVSKYGGITCQIFRGLAALEPQPQNVGQRGFLFFSLSIENEKENGKNIWYIL